MEKQGASAEARKDAVCLDISVHSVDSRLKTAGGREIPFARAVLTIQNRCDVEAVSVLPRAVLGQEGGTVQDVTSALSGSAFSIPPGESVSWDVYERLLPAHPGTASKVHMFGYRAVLNWKFELSVSAEYRTPASTGPSKTPVMRWILRWSAADPAGGAVGLTVEEIRNRPA
jgi:hypothetical protein